MERSDSGMLVLSNAYQPSSPKGIEIPRAAAIEEISQVVAPTITTVIMDIHTAPGTKAMADKGYPSGGTLQFRFNNGQCTDWTDARYAQLTGHHVDWSDDALNWPSSARNSAGWTVSSQAKSPSIIALQPGVQGVESDGYVAVVESIDSNGDVYTSDYNYNGGPDIQTFVTFKPGNGVGFIWHD
ncbi:hypothetical protein K7432_012594 [Basidiobolus ranarum]|uniref:Peptidase C51 domain-containing protein n=1 Tax=Basidiobolus ranarum TaxID=34480 RepID=A0ABR2VS18_9FUNG